MISLYIHIPFCVQKCRYCDFLSGPAPDRTIEAYMDALETEIALTGDILSGTVTPAADDSAAGVLADAATPGLAEHVVDSIFIGGGTPSLLTAGQMDALMSCVRAHFQVLPDAEITAEANPGTVSREKLRSWTAAGINRISIGVQSFDDAELRLLGRIHDSREAVAAYENARAAGFTNVSLDLISALPGQTFSTWEKNLQTAVALGPDHISAYSLILEEGTPLKRDYDNGCLPPVPEDEEDRRMYHFTSDYLGANSYQQYEISNYARDGKASRHNIGYWTGHNYLGLGLGASSMLHGTRFSNTDTMEHYLDALLDRKSLTGYENIQSLTINDQMAEFMYLGLRMTAGISEDEFLRRFNTPLQDIYGDTIQKHLSAGLLERTSGRIFLTRRGIDISNYVMCDFLQ